MESRPRGVPLSAAQATPPPASKVYFSTSSGIRAPLTLDSDFEYSGEKNSDISSSSGSEYESEGFMSGEDEFETASERPFAADPDNETFEETHYVEEYVVSKPFVTEPDEETIEGSSVVAEYVFPNVSEIDPDEEMIEERGHVVKYGASRPFVVDSDKETLGAPMEEEDAYASGVEPQVVDIAVLLPSKPAMPIAQLSGDSDDDSLGSEVPEDDGFSGAIRVPDTGFSEVIYSAPKVKVLGIEEGEEEDSQVETLLDTEIVEDSILGEVVNGDLGSDEEEGIVGKDTVKESNLAEIIGDAGSEVTEEAKAESFMASKEYVSLENWKLDGNDEYTEQQSESNGICIQKRNDVNMDDDADLKSDSTTHMVIDNEEENEVVEYRVVTACNISGLSSGIEYPVDSKPNEANKGFGSANNGPNLIGLEAHVEDGVDMKVSSIREVEVLGKSTDGSDITSNVAEESAKLNLLGADDAVTQILERSLLPESGESKLPVEIPNTASTKFPEPDPFQERKYIGNCHLPEATDGGVMEDGLLGNCEILEPISPGSCLDPDLIVKTTDESGYNPEKLEEDEEGSVSDDETEDLVFGVSETSKQMTGELRQQLGLNSFSGEESSPDHSQRIDGQIVPDSDGEVDTDEEIEGKEIFDSAALAALLKAAAGAGSDGGGVTFTSADRPRFVSLERPAGSSSTFRSLRPTPKPDHINHFNPLEFTSRGESEETLNEEEKQQLERIQQIRVKFLRLVRRLGRSPADSVAAQVLYRLVLAAGRPSSQAFSLESAKRAAMELEAEKKNDLNFSLNILVIGKSGVGKSATINSIFGEEKAMINAFEPATVAVKEIVGTIDGVKVRVLDTPGLRSSLTDQSLNWKILSSIKKLTKNCPPDVVLYVDRVDSQSRDLNDLPLLKSVTSSLGSSIWRNAIVTLTHAASSPPDGPSGTPLSYELFVAQRSRVVQQLISHAVGDLQMNSGLMNPVSLVENHPSCEINGNGELVLPNGESWRTQLLLLCYSMKILSEANSLIKPQDLFDHKKLFGFRVHSPPLPYFLSSLLQSYAHPKLPTLQGGETVDSDLELEQLSDFEQEDEDEYDQLPPFKPLRKSQIAKLTKEQKRAYFEEYDYRIKLHRKKQWRDEVKRFRDMKKGNNGGNYDGYMEEDGDQENGSPAAVEVPLPDMTLPQSFDGDNPAYRYRFLEATSQFLARPVLDAHGWDHDCGYDGVSLEENLAIANRFPAVIAVQITKDKKDFNIHLDSSVSAKHGECGSTIAGLDIQTIGKQLAYILKGETKIKNFKINKTAAGVSVTFLGENVVSGLKLEDQIAVGKQLVLVGSTGAIQSQGDAAYGANLEVRLREKDFPIGQDQTTLGLSLMRWRGDLIWGCNMQSQLSIGRSSKIAFRAGLNNKLSGQISIRTGSSDQLQIALVGLLPIAKTIFQSIFPQ
ncbi:unnamed protein product [Ilex paraguariensis]|uniref:AIG1-type G domain-containing protein n=1 Tax=Ilex paraguariensis TaxID=185542 RepID=A0ABC8SXV2_9AQUA